MNYRKNLLLHSVHGKDFPERLKVRKQQRRTTLLINFSTYVVLGQIRMICLDAVVQDRDNNTLARITLLPGRLNVHVQAIFGAAILSFRIIQHGGVSSSRGRTIQLKGRTRSSVNHEFMKRFETEFKKTHQHCSCFLGLLRLISFRAKDETSVNYINKINSLWKSISETVCISVLEESGQKRGRRESRELCHVQHELVTLIYPENNRTIMFSSTAILYLTTIEHGMASFQ